MFFFPLVRANTQKRQSRKTAKTRQLNPAIFANDNPSSGQFDDHYASLCVAQQMPGFGNAGHTNTG